jgi:hypothetical protein
MSRAIFTSVAAASGVLTVFMVAASARDPFTSPAIPASRAAPAVPPRNFRRSIAILLSTVRMKPLRSPCFY